MNNALRKARTAARLKKSELEALAGLRTGTIYDLESGRRANTAYDSGARILAALADRGVDRRLLDRVFPVKELTGAKR